MIRGRMNTFGDFDSGNRVMKTFKDLYANPWVFSRLDSPCFSERLVPTACRMGQAEGTIFCGSNPQPEETLMPEEEID
jgi:hypothetical protein